jgi:hypothetical protein
MMSDSCSNSGWIDRWTCPVCYEDLVCACEDAIFKCACGAYVRCTLEYEPVCHSVVVKEIEDDY